MAFYIYRYIYHDEIIYVGKTKRPLNERIGEHANERKFFPYLNDCLIQYFVTNTAVEMDIYEKYLINYYSPILNVVDMDHANFAFSLPIPAWQDYNSRDSFCDSKKEPDSVVIKEDTKKVSLVNKLNELEGEASYIENAQALLEMLFEQKVSDGWDERGGYVYYDWDMDANPLPDIVTVEDEGHETAYGFYVTSKKVAAMKWENKISVSVIEVLLKVGDAALSKAYADIRSQILDIEYEIENL